MANEGKTELTTRAVLSVPGAGDNVKKLADVCREAIRWSFRDGGDAAIEKTMLDNVDQCEKDGNEPGLVEIKTGIELRIQP